MTMYGWEEILYSRIGAKKSLTEDLFKKFWLRDEAMLTVPVSTLIKETSVSSTSYPALGSGSLKRIFFNWGVDSPIGSFQFHLHFQIKNFTAGDTAQFQARLYNTIYHTGSMVESAVITFGATNTYEDLTIVIPHADVEPFAGKEVWLEVQAKRVTGSGIIYFKCYSAASRIEHHTT